MPFILTRGIWRCRELVERARVFKRLALIEGDLDSDLEGSLANGLYGAHVDLRERVDTALPERRVA